MSASNAPVEAAQDLICLFCFSSAQLTRVQLVVHQDPQVPFSKAVPSLYWALWLELQDFALACVNLHAVLASPLFQPAQVSL